MTQAYNLSQLANNLNTSGQLDATDGLVNAVPIANGGTGASSASGAALNLVVEIGKLLYPVGSVYINSMSTVNPSVLLGFGTWVIFGAGRVLVSLNSSDPSFDSLEETGGSKDAIAVSHTHTGSTNTAGSHSHNLAASSGDTDSMLNSASNTGIAGWSNGFAGYTGGGNVTLVQANGDHTHTFTTNSAGSSGTNANLQPYITVSMWKRTA